MMRLLDFTDDFMKEIDSFLLSNHRHNKVSVLLKFLTKK